MEKKKRATVADIAREAQVSPATVSRVMNQRFDLVTDQTVQSVYEALRRLGCKVPEPVTPPRAKEKPVLICNIPDGNNPFYEKIIQGALTSANAHGCHLLYVQGPLDHGSIGNFMDLIRTVKASGTILLNHMNSELLSQIASVVPVVQCMEYTTDTSLPYVSIDDRRAAKTATEYLIGRGRNKIAFLNGPTTYKYARERKAGFLDAVNEAGLTIPKNWVVDLPEINYEMAYSAICQLMSADLLPNAFFTVSDTLAAAVLKAARRFHYRVPGDIMVVGFDNTAISSMCTPSITTVNQPAFQEGFTACEMLIKKVMDPEAEVSSILLETELIVRETT